MKPRSAGSKCERLGNTYGTSAGDRPYQRASVAASWSTEVVGMKRPELPLSVSAQGQRRPLAVEPAAAHGAAQYQRAGAPGVIGTGAVGLVGAAEVRAAEGSLPRPRPARRSRRGRPGARRPAGSAGRLRGQLAGVGVEAAQPAEEDLALDRQGLSHRDDARHHAQLVADARGGEGGLQGGRCASAEVSCWSARMARPITSPAARTKVRSRSRVSSCRSAL